MEWKAELLLRLVMLYGMDGQWCQGGQLCCDKWIVHVDTNQLPIVFIQHGTMVAVIANMSDATEHLVETPIPTNTNTLWIFQVCATVDAVFSICGLNVRQKLALICQGVNSIAKLRLLGRDRAAIQTLIKPIVSLLLNRGGTKFSINIVPGLAALVWFYDDCCRLGLPAAAVAFGIAELAEYEATILNEDGGSSDSDNEEVDGPGKLKVDDFITWKEGLMIKLQSMKSTAGVPLYYVVRDDLPVGHDFHGDANEERIHQIRHTRHKWNKNNKRVAQYILSLVQPTDGYEWVKSEPKTDGRAIFQALVQHYQGDNAATTISQAYQTIETLRFTNQYVFLWEVFSTRIKKAYDQLEENGITIPTSEKLHIIKSKINTQNIEFNMLSKLALTSDNPNRTLTEYLSKVAEHVAAEFPGQQGQGQRYRPNVAAVHVSDDTATVETVNGQTICNSVNITDKVRKYPPNEWNALPWNLQQEIMDAKRSRGGGRSQRGRGRGGHEGRKSISSVMTEEGVEDLIQRTTQATIASLSATTDDVSVVTTPTAIDTNTNVTGDATKRTKSAVPQGALKLSERFKRRMYDTLIKQGPKSTCYQQLVRKVQHTQ
jgi:hypothetical protein